MEYSFNYVDIAILICFIPAIFVGISKGLVRQLASFIALVAGIWGGWHFSGLVSQFISKILPSLNSNTISIISFALIFIFIVIIVNYIGYLSSKLIRVVLLGWLDRLLGLFFAILKFSFIISITIYLLESLDKIYHFLPQKDISESAIYSAISSLTLYIFPFIKELQDII